LVHETLARHPRHVALAALVCGLLLSAAGAWAAMAALAFACVGAFARRGALVVAATLLVLAGAWIGAERREAIDRSRLGPSMGERVLALGNLVRRERPVRRELRARFRLSTVGPPGGGDRRTVGEAVQVRFARGLPLPQIAIGDELAIEGSLEPLQSRPGADFDYAAYLRRSGVHALLRADTAHATGGRRAGLAGLVDALRRRAEAGVEAGLEPGSAALARGVVLGQDELISERVSDDFKNSGLAHLLAVSGQNVTLLAVLALPLLAGLGLGRVARLLGVIGLIALYVPLTGAGPSIMRAGAMGVAGAVAALAGRPASRWYALLLAAAFTLVMDPRAWLDPGWQLSFAAVVGILGLAAPLTAAFGRLPQPLPAALAVTVAATLATAPLMAHHFGRLSLVSLFANVVALPAVAPLMWLGMLSAAAGQLSLEAAALLNALNGYCLAYLSAVAHWSAGLPHAAVDVNLALPALAALYAGLVACCALAAWLRRMGGVDRIGARARPPLVAAAAVIAALIASALAPGATPAPLDRFRVTFLDVGQGDATLLQAPGDVAVLVDGGPPESGVVAKLHAAGVSSLDLVVLTHAQEDHQGGLEQVVEELPVGVLLDGGTGARDPTHGRIVSLAQRRGAHIVAPRAGQILRAGALRLRILHPSGEPVDPDDEPNDHAVVMLASYHGTDVFLPADAESNVTAALHLPEVEVLKVAHHGSEDEGIGSLLRRLDPELVVIEVGADNRFGHPHPSTLSALRSNGPRLLRTDIDGDVRIEPSGGGLSVETEH
jgi:competence protein ComEC